MTFWQRLWGYVETFVVLLAIIDDYENPEEETEG